MGRGVWTRLWRCREQRLRRCWETRRHSGGTVVARGLGCDGVGEMDAANRAR